MFTSARSSLTNERSISNGLKPNVSAVVNGDDYIEQIREKALERNLEFTAWIAGSKSMTMSLRTVSPIGNLDLGEIALRSQIKRFNGTETTMGKDFYFSIILTRMTSRVSIPHYTLHSR